MNFKGGYKIIDLRSLTLTPSEDGTTLIDIEDLKVLLQLDSLKEYLDVSKDLKPIYLRVTDNDTVMCELKRDIENNTFYIYAILMGYVLMISAAFTQDEETLFWYVDEAKYLYVSDEVKLENGVLPLIKEEVESGTLENAKPIYYHPIGIWSDEDVDENECRIQFLILDNNSTPYTKATLIAKLQELMDIGAVINANGYLKYDNVCYPVYVIQKAGGEYKVYYHTTTGRANILLSNITGPHSEISDGVNKIN